VEKAMQLASLAKPASAPPTAEPRAVPPADDAPLNVHKLPAYWHARRRAEGKADTSRCAAELERALAHVATPRVDAGVAHEEAQEAFATLCETATCGVAPAAKLQLYLMAAKKRDRAHAELERRARELCEAVEALLQDAAIGKASMRLGLHERLRAYKRCMAELLGEERKS
jgi:hypothetical protein